MIFVLYEKTQIHTFMEHLKCTLNDGWANFHNLYNFNLF